MKPSDYNQLQELLQQFSEASNHIEKLESNIKNRQLRAADDLLPDYSALKVKLTDLESKIRKVVDAFPAELFPDGKRSHKTPFGEVKFHKSSELEFEDVEKVLLKIDSACWKEAARESEGMTPRFTREQLVRTHEEPNLEALEQLDDATLALFGITRVRKDNFSVKPFSMKTDKPAKAERKEAA